MEDGAMGDQFNEDEETVKLVVGKTEFKIDDKFFGECIVKLDEDQKGQYAKIGLKRYSDLVVENQKLKSDLVDLNKDLYAANTKEIVLRQEFETFKLNHQEVPVPSPIPHDQYNAIMKKLEDIGKEQAKTSPVINNIQKTSSENKINIAKAVEIMASRNPRKNLLCKLKLFRGMEDSMHSITIFGTEFALQGVQTLIGEIRRDLDVLQKKKMVSFEQTDKTGMDNLVQLVADNDMEQKEGSVAVIILNFAAETADCLLEDDTMGDMYANMSKVYIPKMCSIAKLKYANVIIVVPPSTPKSLNMITKVATELESIDHEDGVKVLNITKLQMLFEDQSDEEDKVWKLKDDEKLAKKFSMIDGKAQDGWNQFSIKAMISKVVQETLGVNEELCRECGADHGTNGNCVSEMDKKQDNDVQEFKAKASNYNGQESEECLKCFRGHSTANCRVSGDLKCSFNGCYGLGHQQIVHCPKKSETVNRLKTLYGQNFVITRKRFVNYPGPSFGSKRDRKDSS